GIIVVRIRPGSSHDELFAWYSGLLQFFHYSSRVVRMTRHLCSDQNEARIGPVAVYVRRGSNEVLDTLLRIQIRNSSHHRRAIRDAQASPRLLSLLLRRTELLSVNRRIVYNVRNSGWTSLQVKSTQVVPGEHNRIRISLNQTRHQRSNRRDAIYIRHFPGDGYSFQSGSYDFLPVQISSHQNHVDCVLSQESADAFDFSPEICQEGQMDVGREALSRSMKRNLPNRDATSAQALGRIAGLVGNQGEYLPSPASKRLVDSQGAVVRAPVRGMVTHQERPLHPHLLLYPHRRSHSVTTPNLSGFFSRLLHVKLTKRAIACPLVSNSQLECLAMRFGANVDAEAFHGLSPSFVSQILTKLLVIN